MLPESRKRGPEISSRLGRALVDSALFRVICARIATFPVTIVCGLLWLRLVIGHFGASRYALIAVVVGLQFLLVFSDFGTSAHVLEESGRYRVHRVAGELGGALGRAWRTVIIGNALIFLAAAGLAAAGTWGRLLGFPTHPTEVGFAVVTTLAVNVVARPLSLSTALAAGLGRPAVATASQALMGVVSLGAAATCIATDLPLPLVAATPVFGQLVASLPPLVIALRAAPGLLAAGLRGMVTRPATGSRRMRHLAVPMLVIQAVGPLNDQLDRVILSHVSTLEAVATYSLAAQLFSSAQSLVSATLPALWAEYAQIRATSGVAAVARRAFRYVQKLWPLSLLLGGAFWATSWAVGPIVSAHEIHLPSVLCAVLGALLPIGALQTVLGVSLTDPSALRKQTVLIVMTTATNLGLSVLLGAWLGAAGPAFASLAAGGVLVSLLALMTRGRLRAASPGSQPAAAAH